MMRLRSNCHDYKNLVFDKALENGNLESEQQDSTEDCLKNLRLVGLLYDEKWATQRKYRGWQVDEMDLKKVVLKMRVREKREDDQHDRLL